MFSVCTTDGKGKFVYIPKSVRKFINRRVDHYFTDDKYGHDFIEELVNLDLCSRYGHGSFAIFLLFPIDSQN